MNVRLILVAMLCGAGSLLSAGSASGFSHSHGYPVAGLVPYLRTSPSGATGGKPRIRKHTAADRAHEIANKLRRAIQALGGPRLGS